MLETGEAEEADGFCWDKFKDEFRRAAQTASKAGS